MRLVAKYPLARGEAFVGGHAVEVLDGEVESVLEAFDAVSAGFSSEDVDGPAKNLVSPFEETQALVRLPRADDQLDGVFASPLSDEVSAPCPM